MSELTEDNDMTRGVYRRQYAGFVGGTRISAVSLEAEAWFWRVHAAADDYGNLSGEPTMVYALTVGRRAREISIDRVGELVAELLERGLVLEYEANGERYLHVAGFVENQPGGKNGKRVHRVPASPWDGGGNGPADRHGADAAGAGGGTRGKASAGGAATQKRRGGPAVGGDAASGESGGIQNDPESPGRSQPHHYQDHHHNQDHPTAAPAAARGGGVGEASAWKFPCAGTPDAWTLPAGKLAATVADCPDIDVDAELRAARAKLQVAPKTAAEMPAYVLNWLTRSQKNPRLRAASSRPPRRSTPDRPPASTAPPEGREAKAKRNLTEVLLRGDLNEHRPTNGLAVAR